MTTNCVAVPATYVSVDWTCEPVPAWTSALFSVETKTPLPVVDGAVTVALYVPLLLSVTEPTVPSPEDFVIATVAPPDVSVLP